MPVRHVDDTLLTAPGERGALVRRLHAGGRGVSPTETEGLPTPVRVPGASNLGRARILFQGEGLVASSVTPACVEDTRLPVDLRGFARQRAPHLGTLF